MTNYAAYTRDAIYGIGPTKDDALADARFYGAQNGPQNGDLLIAPISDDLYDRVAREGGNIEFELRDGVLKRPL